MISSIISGLTSDIQRTVNATENLSEYIKETINSYFILPSEETGIGNLKLDIIGEQTLTMASDVTDHYVESNTAYQDQISQKPIVYTIQGEVGELVYYEKDSIQTQVGYVSEKLSKIVSFAPSISRCFQQVSDKALKIAGWIDTADNLITRLDKLEVTQTQQQKAYLALIALRNARAPININTPWSDLSNYVITDIKLTQPKETKDKTLISITLKEFRETTLTTVPFKAQDYQNRLQDQKAPTVEQGQTTGVPTSSLFNLFGGK